MSDLSRQLRRIALLPDTGGASDRELLERFLSNREEMAFEVLIRRHGPMVLGICRRKLHDCQLAEDAFQATFLILVRKASAIRKRESIASWLYSVAYRTAGKAQAKLSRLRVREEPMPDIPAPEPPDLSWQELRPLLDDEVQRLSEIYRTPVILCDLEGKTRKEAARLVGCPEGTLSTRLMRARAMLAQRLARRGVTLSAGALGLLLSQQGVSQAVPVSLLTATMRSAAGLALGRAAGVISPQVAALTEGVMKNMLLTQLMKSAAVALTVCLLCAGAVLFSYGTPVVAPHEAESAVPPPDAARRIDPAQNELRAQLVLRITLEKGIDPQTRLKDALDFLRDRYDLPIEIDSERFEAAGVDQVERQRVSLPELVHVRLATVLRMITKQVNGVCLISAKSVIIVPDDEKVVKDLLAAGHAPLPPGAENEEAQSRVFALVTKAYHNTLRQLRSGSGNGTFGAYAQGPNDKEPRFRTRASVTLHVDHKRYYMSLHFSQQEEKLARRIIISDNSAVYSSYFLSGALDIRSSGGEVYELGEHSSDGFPWKKPCDVIRPLLDVDQWIGMAGENIQVKELPEGGYTIRVRRDNVYTSCTALKRFDWNVSELKIELEGQQVPLDLVQATWKKSERIWYVARLENRQGPYRAILRLDDFKPNVAISPHLFRLASLDLPVGAGILDHRRYGTWHIYQPIPDDGSRRFFDMEAELESLPAR